MGIMNISVLAHKVVVGVVVIVSVAVLVVEVGSGVTVTVDLCFVLDAV